MMSSKAVRLAACVALVGGFAVFTSDSYAQSEAAKPAAAAVDKKKGTGSLDKKMASRKGMDSLATKEIDSKQLPGKFEVGLALGSVVAMIAAIKYL